MYIGLCLILDAHDDVCVLERFNHVIIDGAMTYMMHFRSNAQAANMHQQKFDMGIRSMKRVLLMMNYIFGQQ